MVTNFAVALTLIVASNHYRFSKLKLLFAEAATLVLERGAIVFNLKLHDFALHWTNFYQ